MVVARRAVQYVIARTTIERVRPTARRVVLLPITYQNVFAVSPDQVVLTRAAAAEADPVIGQFLDFLARDIAAHSERLQRIDMGLVQRGRELTAGVKFDMDAPLSPEDE